MHPMQDQNLSPLQVTQLTKAMLSVAVVVKELAATD